MNAAVGGAGREKSGRSPLEQLLHALNQPLTGLQCSMEVALAAPRTPAQYVQGLRDGLVLTERMRMLVEALREVAEAEEEQEEKTAPGANEGEETTEVNTLLREVVEDLRPVAETKNVGMVVNFSSPSVLAVRARRAPMMAALFGMLESILALADAGSIVRIDAGLEGDRISVGVCWRESRDEGRSTMSRPELGLLIAQARLKRSHAGCEREATEDSERLTLRMPRVAAWGEKF